jgi:Fe-S cluster assembly iron-binding protein IscA
MIDVTASAMDELKAIREKGKVSCIDEFKEIAYGADESDIALRLVPTQTGHLALILDVYHKGDTFVEHEGTKVLLIDAELIDVVDGLRFDCIETPEGRRLEISNPVK